ncbi:glycosyltransferase, partial [Cloacibacillus porcorum]
LENGGVSQFYYFNNYIEYAIAGIPGIYSACSPYTYIIKDGVNGVLCGDSSADWYSALCKLIDDELIRERIKCNSKNQLKDEFAIEKIVNMLIKNYPKIITFRAPTSRCGVKIYWLQFCRKISIMQECCYFARLALQNGGVKLLLVRIYRYFYRLRKNSSTEKRLKKI